MRHALLSLVAVLGLSACAVQPPVPAPSPPNKGPIPTIAPGPGTVPDRLDGRTAVRNFVQVIGDVEPVAERVCRARAPQFNCDFLIVVDDTVNAPPNAFQTVDDAGRPVIAFTVPLIAEARNRDELAFILAHEASHHIEGHLDRQRRNAQIGASILGTIAGQGGNADTIRTAQEIGAAIGARTYSKDFELEADALGARIALMSGYDPLIGAEFFTRIPDPGNRFLGTHPANADRVATVRNVVLGRAASG